MRYAAQLDLIVVSHKQPTAVAGCESGAEHTPPSGADRDVVQVGIIGAETAGASHSLIETWRGCAHQAQWRSNRPSA